MDVSAQPATGLRPLYVPVRSGPAGVVVRLWRTPVGTRTAVAFTTDQRLRAALGPCQRWIRLSDSALRRLAEPLGATALTVDPLLFSRPAFPRAAPPTPQLH
ncbi:SAV_915 family protein [Streptomyces sp. NBC_01477]|uniref:SAV_915 family protein n=1 Tax=Streptomyces sp. NBC_01477 TaxID=2976015 RepID=UPI002E367E77|nr:SAV_915 family protein [Streptomyces sp. NBC_01477]